MTICALAKGASGRHCVEWITREFALGSGELLPLARRFALEGERCKPKGDRKAPRMLRLSNSFIFSA